MKKDLLKLQNNYHIASVENAKEANLSIRQAQGWILTLGLAELAFLSSLGDFSSGFVKVEVTLLLFAFIFFVIGSVAQYRHALKGSRDYFSLSSMILKHIEKIGTHEVEEIPENFSDNEKLRTSNIANHFIFLSFVLIGVSTVLIWFSLIF